jgi:tetratricopeptide (TPR) repeat protein
MDRARNVYLEAFKMDGDSVKYLTELGDIIEIEGDFYKAIDYCNKVLTIDSTNAATLFRLAMNYQYLNKNNESFKYFIKYSERLRELGELNLNRNHRIGYTYWQIGKRKEADSYFEKQLNLQ